MMAASFCAGMPASKIRSALSSASVNGGGWGIYQSSPTSMVAPPSMCQTR